MATRHNTGFMVIHHLARAWDMAAPCTHSHSLVGEGSFAQGKVILAQPLTFMNRSGLAVKYLLGKYVLPLDRILIIYDDMDLDIGQIRIRKKGGDGGHRGLRSIIHVLGCNTFPRLRIGIGRPLEGLQPMEYVLHPFSPLEEETMEVTLKKVEKAVEMWIKRGIDEAMNTYNG